MRTNKSLRIQILRTRLEAYDEAINQIGKALGSILRARETTEKELKKVEKE